MGERLPYDMKQFELRLHEEEIITFRFMDLPDDIRKKGLLHRASYYSIVRRIKIKGDRTVWRVRGR